MLLLFRGVVFRFGWGGQAEIGVAISILILKGSICCHPLLAILTVRVALE